MAKKGQKMNLAEFNGPLASDLPSAPSGDAGGYGGGYGARSGGYGDRDGGRTGGYGGDRDGGRGGGYGGDRGGDRDGPRGGFGDRESAPRRRFNEDGEEEPEAPSRADEADKWRRRDAPAPERSREEMPGRSDNEDKWRPRGDAPPRDGDRPGGFGGPRSFGGDRDGPRGGFGDRDGGRGYGDRDGGRGYGDRDGGRGGYGDRDGGRGGYGDRDGGRGGFGGDRDGPRGGGYGGSRDFGGSSGGDSRPAHLKNLVKKGASGDAAGASPAASDESPAPSAAPSSDRFKKPPPEEGAGEEEAGGERQERRPFGGDRDGGRDGDRPRFGGDRDGGDRPRFGGDRDGGDRPRFGGDRDAPRDGGRFGGDRDGPRGGGYGGDRFGDRDGGRSGGYGDRDGGRGGGYGGSRFGDRDGGAPRYGGYGAAARSGGGMNDPLPTGPASRQEDDRPARLNLKPKVKDSLAAKPQSMEERNVEIDSSVASKNVTSIASKITPLESAVENNDTITEAQLSESMARVKLTSGIDAFGNVLAKSVIDGKVGLGGVVSAALTKSEPKLLLETLKQLKAKKSDKYVLDAIATAQAKEPELNVLKALVGDKAGKELDTFLESHGLLSLKPIPDLSASIDEQLKAGAKPESIVEVINKSVDAKLAPGSKVATLVAAHVFALAFKDGKLDTAAIKPWAALLTRVAPGSDADAQFRVLLEGQGAWFRAGAGKGLVKELFVFLLAEKLIRATSFLAWREDTTEKGKNGKPKALIQVAGWVTEVQPKVREQEAESDADDELANEYGDDN